MKSSREQKLRDLQLFCALQEQLEPKIQRLRLSLGIEDIKQSNTELHGHSHDDCCDHEHDEFHNHSHVHSQEKAKRPSWWVHNFNSDTGWKPWSASIVGLSGLRWSPTTRPWIILESLIFLIPLLVSIGWCTYCKMHDERESYSGMSLFRSTSIQDTTCASVPFSVSVFWIFFVASYSVASKIWK